MKLKELLERYEGKNNSNYKGKGKRKERAEHLAAEKNKKSYCEKCNSRDNLELAETPPGSKKFKTLCKSCHSKYDKKQSNFKK